MIPTGADKLYPRITQGTQTILPYHALVPQAPTQQMIHTQAQHVRAAPQTGSEEYRRAEQQAKQICTRGPNRRKAHITRDASDDDLGTEATEKVRDSRSERAATGHTAAGHNKRRRNTDEAGHWNGRDRTRRIYEEEVGWHMADRHTMVKAVADGSEPHVAAHTTAMAHMAKRGEKHKQTNEDEDEGGRRQRTRRGSDREMATAPDAAQPCACTGVEPSSLSWHSCEPLDNIPEKDPG